MFREGSWTPPSTSPSDLSPLCCWQPSAVPMELILKSWHVMLVFKEQVNPLSKAQWIVHRLAQMVTLSLWLHCALYLAHLQGVEL